MSSARCAEAGAASSATARPAAAIIVFQCEPAFFISKWSPVGLPFARLEPARRASSTKFHGARGSRPPRKNGYRFSENCMRRRLVPLEVLHRAFMLLGRGAGQKRPEIAPPAGLRILLARVETVFARLELADHQAPDSYARPPIST